MAKDPAFLFYPGDWIGGTMLFSRSHKGAYMDLLMAQFNNGHLSMEDIKTLLGSDFESMWKSKLAPKFKTDDGGLFFNQKLEHEMIKRKLYTASRRENLNSSGSHKDEHMDNHMENENKDGDKVKNKKGVQGEKIDEAGKKLEKFIKPTTAEITAYLLEQGVTPPPMFADKFIDYYESIGWKVGKNPMKKWKNTVKRWLRNDYENKTVNKNHNGGGKINPDTFAADLAAVCAR